MRQHVSSWVFYSLWIITALGIAGVYWIIHAQENVTERLSVHLDEAEKMVVAGRWDDASEALRQVTEQWHRIEKIWALHTQHEEMDPVGDALLQAEALIQQTEPSALAALRVARHRMEHLPRRERLLLSNLL